MREGRKSMSPLAVVVVVVLLCCFCIVKVMSTSTSKEFILVSLKIATKLTLKLNFANRVLQFRNSTITQQLLQPKVVYFCPSL